MSVVAFSILSSLSFGAQAQSACEDLFSVSEIRFQPMDFSIKSQMDPVKLASMTLQVLKMASLDRSGSFTEKQVVEKGELVLASPLKNGWSVESEYAIDQRGDVPVFRLSEVELVKPNGDSTVLDKAPLTDDGLAFKKDTYPIGQINSQLDADVQIPLSIQGPLLENINKWAGVAEYIKRGEIRDLKEGSQLKTLRGKVFVRSTIDYTTKVVKKQSFKFFLLGMVMYLYAQRDSFTKEVVLVDPWDKFKRQSDLALADNKMRTLMQAQVQLLTGNKNIKLPESYARESFRYFDFQDTLEKIDILNKLERTAGSKMKVAWLHQGKFAGLLSAKDLHMDFLDTLDETDAVVLYFSKTERMLVLSGSWMKFERTSDLIVPYALSWNGGVDGTIYNILKEKFKSLKKEF